MHDHVQFARWVGQAYPLNPPSDLSFRSLIALGRYDEVDLRFTEANFSVLGDAARLTKRVGQFGTGQSVSTDEVCGLLKGRRMRLSSPLELLVFGAQYPREQSKHCIIAHSLAWRGPHGQSYVPCLTVDGPRRVLWIQPKRAQWPSDVRFLVSDLG